VVQLPDREGGLVTVPLLSPCLRAGYCPAPHELLSRFLRRFVFALRSTSFRSALNAGETPALPARALSFHFSAQVNETSLAA
jgi:hypothetical protein